MNKNISVWRGSKQPPTNYHLWVDENNNIKLWDETGWKTIADGENYSDIVEHLESFPKIDVINEIPNGNDFKDGEFLLYELGKDITIPSSECYEFGKTTSFTIREGDLCLIGKVKHTPTLLEAEHPKFSDKYKYKIRFNANLSYYFGGTGNIGEPVLTTTTQPLTYSLIGSEDKCIIKCGNYYAFISGERLCLTDLLSYATYFVLHELEPNKFELLNYSSQSSALNAYQGLGTAGDYSDEIRWYNAGRPGNIILFLPQESELIVKKIIYTTQEATTSYSGLMSKEDKSKLNSIARNANNYSLPAASSSTRGGIKVGYSQTANNRAVQLSSEKAYVSIPDATTSQAGLMSSSDKTTINNLKTVATTGDYNDLINKPEMIIKWRVLDESHLYVDLGLPSGTLWATCNIGANSPELYGNYYAWGETEEKENYSWSTYKWCNGRENTMTKYCTDNYKGTIDNKTVLDPEDDVAHVKWGGRWRMPTLDEQKELLKNCTWTKTYLKGNLGYNVTGPNGNSIFLPSAGYLLDNGLVISDKGYYWSNTVDNIENCGAFSLYFNATSYDWYSYFRYVGLTVRPVFNN